MNAKPYTNLTSLDDNGIQKWEPKVFSGRIIYRVDERKGRLALQAISRNAASGLMLKKKIDLALTPHINWIWLVEKKLQQLNGRTKSGNDFIARIYVVIDGGFILWKTKSLNYVWSSNQDKGLIWDNPFAGSSVKMMSIRGKGSEKGKWYQEKRNVYQDLIE